MRIFKKFLANLIPTPKTDQVAFFVDSNDGKLTRKESNGSLAKYVPESGKKVYKALLSQSGTDAPTAIVLENTLGVTITWSRLSVGKYRGTFTNPISGIFCYRKRESYLAFDDVEHVHIDINVTGNYILIDQFINQYIPSDGLNFYFENFPFLLEVYP